MKATGGVIINNGKTYPIQFVERDTQSNPNRAAEVTQELILGEKVDIVLCYGGPENANPASDQCELNGVPCLASDLPIQPWFFGRNGDPKVIAPFRVCGATCDSVDILSRPFWLPETVDTGDWIEIGHIGAYSLSLRTRFNGFYPDTFVEVTTPFDAGGKPEGYASLETMGE